MKTQKPVRSIDHRKITYTKDIVKKLSKTYKVPYKVLYQIFTLGLTAEIYRNLAKNKKVKLYGIGEFYVSRRRVKGGIGVNTESLSREQQIYNIPVFSTTKTFKMLVRKHMPENGFPDEFESID